MDYGSGDRGHARCIGHGQAVTRAIGPGDVAEVSWFNAVDLLNTETAGYPCRKVSSDNARGLRLADQRRLSKMK